jgi:hypothetical protein
MTLQIADCRLQIGWAIGVALVALAIVVGAPRAAHADEIIERVLAVAGGELITQSDVAAARELGLLDQQMPADARAPIADADVHAIVSRLVDRALMLDEVDRYAPPEPTAEAVDRAVSTVRARFDSQAAFEAALARVGFDDRYLRGVLRQDLRIQAYIAERFAAAPQSPSSISPADSQKLRELHQVEPRVRHDRRHDRPAAQVHHAPKRPEDARREHRVPSLDAVPEPEADADDDDAHEPAAEPALEPVQEERALDLLAHASRDDDDQGEDGGTARRPQKILERIVLDGPEPRRDQLNHEEHADCEQQRREHQADAGRRLRRDRTAAEQHLRRAIAAGDEQEQDEPDEDDRVDQREGGHERDVQGAVRVLLMNAGDGQRLRDQNLRRVFRTEEHFEERHRARRACRTVAGRRVGGEGLVARVQSAILAGGRAEPDPFSS